MFSQILTPAARSIENRDALVARKPGTVKTAREPLSDRAVNPSLSNVKQKPDVPKLKFEQAKPKLASAEIKRQVCGIPDWYGDMCSFKEVQREDTYDDIWPASQRLSSTDFLNSMKPPTTPKFTFDSDLLPMLIEIPKQPVIRDFGADVVEEVPVDAVDFPDFDFAF